MEVALIVLEGKQKGRKIPLPETIFLIGRDRQCHLRPHCQGVSNLHCALAAWAGKVRVRDLKSRNGTFLNGRRIHGEVQAEDGDRIQVGALVFAFRINNEDGLPHAAPVAKGDVAWLLNTPADSAVLAEARKTHELPTPADPEEAEAEPATSPGSRAVSAGGHLHAYFRKRKRAVAEGPGPEPGAG
jgi:predicted component of type VI protein secretion system